MPQIRRKTALNPRSVLDTIAAAAASELTRRMRLFEQLLALDLVVAARAIEVFEDIDSAAEWLMSNDLPRFKGRAPVDLARTKAGKRQVMQTLGAIEHGVWL